MNKNNLKFLPQIIIIAAVILIGFCFVTSMLIVDKYAENDCFDSIEETTSQISDMFSHSLKQRQTQLTLFADILAVNEFNSDDLLQTYMKNFCSTQNFAAVCIHWQDGNSQSYGFHPHEEVNLLPFKSEITKLPYISDVYSEGDKRSEKYVYQAVPVKQEENTVGILYGYISLDKFPEFISSTAYDGKCEFYIVDGNTGDFMMDEYHRYGKDDTLVELPLGNVYDGSMGSREAKDGYSMDKMSHNMKSGESGYFIFKSQRTGQWYYTYYLPMDINNWSMQLTIDEPTAFASYYRIRHTVFVLMLCVLILAFIIVLVLMFTNHKARKKDKENLKTSDYVNAVKTALITAHNNPDFVAQALRHLAKEHEAEKAILLIFSDNAVNDIYYWPTLDMSRAKGLIGLNFRENFPIMYDTLMSNEIFFCDRDSIETRFTQVAKELFQSLSVFNMQIVPILDNSGMLKGAIATLNMDGDVRNPEMLKLVTNDFYMAIANLESYTIIKNMGSVDYLTGVKNRNSYEAEIKKLAILDKESLWCAYIDVNGLHEVNNTKGHEAGDLMLRTVAKVIKNVFGDEWTYRLGGDEFVAFAADSNHDDFMSCKYRVLSELAEKGYYVSVGFEGATKNENKVFDVNKLVKEAETIMYKEKMKFYEKHQIPCDREHIPLQAVLATTEEGDE